MLEGKFELGRTVATPGALSAIGIDAIGPIMSRHHSGDWGEVCEEDRGLNDVALNPKLPLRILSVYTVESEYGEDVKVWIITEWDRSVTTVLLPEEY